MVMLAVVRECVDGEVEAEAAKVRGFVYCHLNFKFSIFILNSPSPSPYSKLS